DSGKVRTFKSLPDTTIRLVPGETLADVCVRRIHEDQAGFTLYPPVLDASGRGDNVYLRDLHGLDSLELQRYPGRPVWLMLKNPAVGSPLRFAPVNVDSMRAEWGEQDGSGQ
ncbi:MAG: hypothetical protein ACREL5_07395, partial [Gemmatimonadales bacterium]